MESTISDALNTSRILELCKSGFEKLLSELQPKEGWRSSQWDRVQKTLKADKLRSSVDKLNRHCQQLNNLISLDTALPVAQTYNVVKESGDLQKAHYLEERDRKMLTWISTLDFGDRQRDVLSRRHPDTGIWLLHTDAFIAWRDSLNEASTTLWCPGIPGAGKTVMTSIVVKHLQEYFPDGDVAVAYVYCDYKDRKKQTSYQLISSLLKQVISQHHREMHIGLSATFKSHGDGTIPLSMNECLVLLSNAMYHFRCCFLLVDALDEHMSSQDDAAEDDIQFIDELQQILRQTDHKSRYRLFVTSRDIGIIHQKLHDCVREEISAPDLDIRLYVRSRILSPNFRFHQNCETDSALLNIILASIVAKSRGMFLLPQLHLDRLGSQTSIRNLRKALDVLPSKLDETYNDAMERITKQNESDADLALRALLWISHAVRPLKVEELQHALAIEPFQIKFDPEGLCDEKLLTSVAAGLISIDSESRIVRLVHFSVDEYFQREGKKWFPDAEKKITVDCLSYLGLEDFSDACPNRLVLRSRMDCFKLLEYATSNWAVHALRCPKDVILRTILLFLDGTKPPPSGALQAMLYQKSIFDNFCSRHQRIYDYENLENVHVFQIAVLYKLWDTVLALLLKWSSVQDSEQGLLAKRTTIHLAAFVDFTKALKLLLDNGADIEAKDLKGRTALHVAVFQGHKSALRVLLEHNASC